MQTKCIHSYIVLYRVLSYYPEHVEIIITMQTVMWLGISISNAVGTSSHLMLHDIVSNIAFAIEHCTWNDAAMTHIQFIWELLWTEQQGTEDTYQQLPISWRLETIYYLNWLVLFWGCMAIILCKPSYALWYLFCLLLRPLSGPDLLTPTVSTLNLSMRIIPGTVRSFSYRGSLYS